MRVGFCVSGNGSLFRAAVLHRAELPIEPLLVITETKAAADIETFSSQNGLRCVRLDPADRPTFDRALTATLIAADLDLIALTFDRVLPPEVVRHYAGRVINVHPALLPAFGGKGRYGHHVHEAVLANYLKNEYPQTVAVVLSKIRADHAARLIGKWRVDGDDVSAREEVIE